jgi:hypothetical protein
MSPSDLNSLLATNVLDIRFVRRVPVKGKPMTRRMICTKSTNILTSNNGLISLGYRAPVFAPKYNPESEGLVVGWDILMQDFRNINAETVTVLNTIPGDDKFWTYFNNELRLMSTQQKINFMMS